MRVALAGLGVMGQNHLRVLRSMEGVELVATADPDITRGVLGIPHYPELAMMLAAHDLDAAVIAAPTRAHADLIAETDRWFPKFVEKPLAASYAQALVILGHRVMVGHIERFNPAITALRENLARAGEVRFISTRRSGLRGSGARTLDGVAMDLASHDVDLVCWLLGAKPSRVVGITTGITPKAPREDLLSGLLDFEPQGAVGLVTADWLSPTKVRTMRVLGTMGSFEIDLLGQELVFHSIDGTSNPITVERAEPLRLELAAFIEAVKTGAEMPITAVDGARAVHVVETLLLSAASGRPAWL